MKKEKRNHIPVLVLAAVVLSMSSPVMAENTQRNVTGEISQTELPKETVSAESNERKATITVISISGNKLTYYEQERTAEAESSEAAETSKEETDKVTYDNAADGNDSRNESIPEGFPGDGNIPEGFSRSGNMPEGLSRDGNMPEGSGWGQNRMEGSGSGRNRRNSFSGNMPGNVKTVYLPVAVPVHIGESEVRTFTIIQAGDTLEALYLKDEEEEVITEFWLIKTGEDN